MPHDAAGDRADQPRKEEEHPHHGSTPERPTQRVSQTEPDDQLERYRGKGEHSDIADSCGERPVGEDRLEVVQPDQRERGLRRRVVGQGGDESEERRDEKPDRKDDSNWAEEEGTLGFGEPHPRRHLRKSHDRHARVGRSHRGYP